MGCKNSKVIPVGKPQRREPQTSEEVMQELIDCGFLKNRVKGGGVAFQIGNDMPVNAPPRRLAKLEVPASTTAAEEQECILLGKQFDAERRRMFRAAERKAKLEERKAMRESVILRKAARQ